jgi:hypothetical protein
MAAQGAIINGTIYSWSNIQVIISGNVVESVTKLEYKRTLKAEPVYTTGQEVYGYSYGQYTYEASIEMLTEDWKAISAAAGGNPLSLPPFTISVLFLQSENGVIFPFKDILFNCQFLSDPMSSGTGETAIKVSIPMLISGFSRWN